MTNIHLAVKCEKLCPWGGTETRVAAQQHFVRHCTTKPRQEGGFKGTRFEKPQMKQSLFTDDMVIYKENLKKSASKLLKAMSELSKVAVHMFNVQGSILLIKRNNDHLQILFIVVFQTLQLWIPETLQQRIPETGSCKILKENEGKSNIWGNRACLWMANLNIVKMSILPSTMDLVQIQPKPKQGFLWKWTHLF